MFEWLHAHKYKLLVLSLVAGLTTFLIVTGVYSNYLGYSREPSRVLQELGKKLNEDPYESAVLLESARFHYKSIREKLQSDQSRRAVRALIREGLSQYRRLIANPDWNLSRRDYFYAAYLYYNLGPAYYGRAKSLALKSYNLGFRSRSLITLLANVEYEEAESKEDYKVALNYYKSLGSGIKDPVLLYNKSQTLRELGKYEKALQNLKRGEQYLDRYPGGKELSSKFRLAKVQIRIEQGTFKKALSYVRTIPREERSLKLRTLYARCLIEVGRVNRARSELKEVVSFQGSPQEAKILLKDLTEESKQARS